MEQLTEYKFNHIKIEDSQGIWKTYNFQNNIKEKIKRAKNVYVSVNKFINFKEHPTYNYQNKIMKKYGLIDIDGQDFKNINECKNYFLHILNFLKEKNIRIDEIVQTNSVVFGFQILIHPNSYKKFIYLLASSLLREEDMFKKIDWRVINDDKRVRRLKNTWNSNHNSMAIPLLNRRVLEFFQKNWIVSLPVAKTTPVFNPTGISKSQDLNSLVSNKELVIDFSNLFEKLSPLFSRHYKESGGFPLPSTQKSHALGMPLDTDKQPLEPVSAGKPSKVVNLLNEANDNKAVAIQPILTSEQRQGQEIKSNLPCHFLVKQISSSVYGSKNNYVPVLKYFKKPSSRRIKRLQKAFSLGDVYLFQNHQEFVTVSPKTAQKERLEKLYKKARCWKSLSELAKFKQNWIFCSNIFDLNKRKSIKTIRLLDFFPQEANGYYSYPHNLFLKKYHNMEYNNLIGTKLKVYVAEFRA